MEYPVCLWIIGALKHPYNSCWFGAKESICLPMQETWVWFLGWKDPLEKETATHSSILAWEIILTVEPRRLQSMGSQKSQMWLSNYATTKTILFIRFSSVQSLSRVRLLATPWIAARQVSNHYRWWLQPRN